MVPNYLCCVGVIHGTVGDIILYHPLYSSFLEAVRRSADRVDEICNTGFWLHGFLWGRPISAAEY